MFLAGCIDCHFVLFDRLKSLSGAEDGHVTIYGLERASMMDSLFPGDMDASQTSATASSKDLDDEVEPSFRDIDSGAIGQHHMQRLKEFLSEKGGTIDEDWRVEVKKRVNTEKTFDVTFFSPDGQKFRSRPEVARFLGILDQKKDGKVMDAEPRDLSTPVTRKKRKEVFREQRQDEVSTVVEQSNDYFLESVKRQKSESYNHSEPQDPILDLEIQACFLHLPLEMVLYLIFSLGENPTVNIYGSPLLGMYKLWGSFTFFLLNSFLKKCGIFSCSYLFSAWI
jgi:hypothetical protein